MNIKTLTTAIREAERFVRVAKKVKWENSAANMKKRIIEGTKESAAAKRASMDLTRVLADLRQGR